MHNFIVRRIIYDVDTKSVDPEEYQQWMQSMKCAPIVLYQAWNSPL